MKRIWFIILIMFFCIFLFIKLEPTKYQEIEHKVYNRLIIIKYNLYDFFWDFNRDKDISIDNIAKNDIDDKDRVIAHAGGSVDGDIYTDSLEALDSNYKKGFKLFELDFLKTKDDFFVAVHDWNSWKEHTGYQKELPPTLKEFKKYKIYSKYTPLDMELINRWFFYHKDAILVTDKVNTPFEFSKRFIDKDRVIMELFDWYAVLEAKKLGIEAMPTGNLVKELKENIVKKLLDLNINYVALSRKFIDTDIKLLQEMRDNNIKIYAFYLNMEKGKDEEYVYCNELTYFYGFYADKWDFNATHCLKKK